MITRHFFFILFQILQELERITLELEEEKRKIEETARELLEEHEKTK